MTHSFDFLARCCRRDRAKYGECSVRRFVTCARRFKHTGSNANKEYQYLRVLAKVNEIKANKGGDRLRLET